MIINKENSINVRQAYYWYASSLNQFDMRYISKCGCNGKFNYVLKDIVRQNTVAGKAQQYKIELEKVDLNGNPYLCCGKNQMRSENSFGDEDLVDIIKKTIACKKD